MGNEIYIVGSGDYSDVMTEIVADSNYELDGYLDEQKFGTIKRGFKVQSLSYAIENFSEGTKFVVAIGDNKVRMRIAKTILNSGGVLPTLIHSTAFVSPSAAIGIGCSIGAKAIVLAQSVIADNCMVCAGAIISHHSKCESCSLIGVGAHIGSRSAIGGNVLVGAGATIKPGGLEIGRGSIVGAGTVVLNNVPEDTVYYGLRRN